MLNWLKDFWSDGQGFRSGLRITLTNEEIYVHEGYNDAKRGQSNNPYSGQKGQWWGRGWNNFHIK